MDAAADQPNRADAPPGGEPGPEPTGFLHRNLKVACSAVSFLQDTASEMVYPVLPFLVTSLLGANAAALGFIEGLADATASVTKRWSAGRLSGKLPRPPAAGGRGL